MTHLTLAELLAVLLMMGALAVALREGLGAVAERARTGRLRRKGPRPGRHDQVALDAATEALANGN